MNKNKGTHQFIKIIIPHTSLGKKAFWAFVLLFALIPIFNLAISYSGIKQYELFFDYPILAALTVIAITVWLVGLTLGITSIWKQKERSSIVITGTVFIALFTVIFVLAVATE